MGASAPIDFFECMNCRLMAISWSGFEPAKSFKLFIAPVVSLLTAVLVVSANAAGLAVMLSPGNHTITLSYGGRERSAMVHVPPRAVEIRGLPVVLNFHGGGGHAGNEQEYSMMDRVADREIFVAVYPNGTGRLSKRLLTWNAGTCCAYAVINNIDDAGFTRALVADLAQRISIDRLRIYATGLSNGAMMAHRLAAEAADLVAAVAPVAGGMVVPAIKSSRTVPVMHIHSVNDIV
jgi:polyhydroxybutyrate depolymerase